MGMRWPSAWFVYCIILLYRKMLRRIVNSICTVDVVRRETESHGNLHSPLQYLSIKPSQPQSLSVVYSTLPHCSCFLKPFKTASIIL